MTIVLAAGGVQAQDLGPDTDLARRVLLRARRLAPCLADAVADEEKQAEVLAVLKGVYKRAVDIGTGVIASQGRNGTSRSYRDVRSAFTAEDVSDLRFLCSGADAPAGAMPVGSFPTERPLSKLWPEGPYS